MKRVNSTEIQHREFGLNISVLRSRAIRGAQQLVRIVDPNAMYLKV